LLIYILNNLYLVIGAQMKNLRAKRRVYYPVTDLIDFKTILGVHQTNRRLKFYVAFSFKGDTWAR